MVYTQCPLIRPTGKPQTNVNVINKPTINTNHRTEMIQKQTTKINDLAHNLYTLQSLCLRQ